MPISVQILHAFEHLHEKVSYHDHNYKYLNEVEEDCGICDLMFETSSTPPVTPYHEDFLDKNYSQEIISYTFLKDYKNTSFLLRGPPHSN